MAQTVFNIDGPIGSWGFSKQMITQMLAKAGANPVLVNISSLGGDVDHALAIHDSFVNHGSIDARLSGFVASSATIIASGARNVVMNSTAFYLIHKVSGWIDEFGFKNEDELQQLIDRFAQEAEENKKIDLVIAQIYSKRTGKDVQDIVDLMKKETWLTAQEAKEWGFVDEIIEMTGKVNEISDAKVAMIEAAGLPPIPRKHETNPNNDQDVETTARSILNSVKNLLKSEKHSKMDRTKFKPLLNAVNVDDIELDKDGGFYVNAAQVDLINEAIAKAEKAESERQAAVDAKKAAEKAQQEAETARQNILNSLDEIDETVKSAENADGKINALKTRIAKVPGTGPTGNDGGDDNQDGVDWESINSLPHNKQADAEL